MKIQHYFHFPSDINSSRLERVERLLEQLVAGDRVMAQNIDEIKTEVEKNRSVTQSAIALIDGIAAKLEEMKDDPEEIAAIAADLRSQSTSLADAVSRNTPAEGGGEPGTEPTAPPVDPLASPHVATTPSVETAARDAKKAEDKPQ